MDPMGICLKLQKLVAEMFEPKKQDESSIFGHSIFFRPKNGNGACSVQPQRLLFPSQTMDCGNGESKKRIKKR